MAAFAMYRLPNELHATCVMQCKGEAEVIPSVSGLNGKEGFVIAPFSSSDECPILLMHPDSIKQLAIPDIKSISSEVAVSPENEKELYAYDFDDFHQQLEQGIFQKIVLARCAHVKAPIASAEDLFMKACRLYPRLFVALVSTPQSGTWLMATPEILLSGKENTFFTMALAGTQRTTVWSGKNREEQQCVADYIEDCIKEFADDYSLDGPYTTMAAQLYHLRTDFRFHLQDGNRLGDVLDKLFPTPAVCGIPKDLARQFILSHEHQSRKYYSGFVGPLSFHGDTHLYVSLRCMNILGNGMYDLYAGGGLLVGSEMQKEWEETEAKLQTMKVILYNH